MKKSLIQLCFVTTKYVLITVPDRYQVVAEKYFLSLHAAGPTNSLFIRMSMNKLNDSYIILQTGTHGQTCVECQLTPPCLLASVFLSSCPRKKLRVGSIKNVEEDSHLALHQITSQQAPRHLQISIDSK